MRKAAFFLIVLFTCYLAAMYRSLPLMTLCAAELLLSLIMFILPRIFRTKLNTRFPKQSESTTVSMDTACRISVINSGKLPISRIALKLRIGYTQDTKTAYKLIYSSGECGESDTELQIRFSYCGMVRVRVERVRAFDYLSLFSSLKKLSDEMNIAVFPREQALSVTVSDLGLNESRLPRDETVSRTGDAYHEIRQIREYRMGDPIRHIHRNQSAKTEQLWIKEYERETDSTVDVFADMTGIADAAREALSAFYTLLSALVLGLLREAATVSVCWYAGKSNVFMSKSVGSAEQCRDMLLALYRTDFSDSSVEKSEMQNTPFGEHSFRLTLSLGLLVGNELIYRFSQNELEKEIKEKIFIL